MRVNKVVCDRCGKDILLTYKAVSISDEGGYTGGFWSGDCVSSGCPANTQRAMPARYDLCTECAAALAAFIKEEGA